MPSLRHDALLFLSDAPEHTSSVLCSDKSDDSMPLIKFARKLAESASEHRSTAAIESQGVGQEQDEQDQVRVTASRL